MDKKYRLAVCALVFKEDKYLIVNTKGWSDKIWCFPQGGKRENEDDFQAIKRELKEELGEDFSSVVQDFCASFQKTIADSLLFKVKKVVKKYKPKQLLLGGGVIANIYIIRQFRREMRKLGVEVITPSKILCTDNAAMIGVAAYYRSKREEFAVTEVADFVARQ